MRASTSARAAAGSKGATAISDGFWTLERTALCLRRRAALRKALPALLFFTDPARTPDMEAVAERLPRGTAIVFRAFGAADALAQAQRLKAIARRRGLKLLIGADERLAAQAKADGVHLPERLAGAAPRLRARHPRWIVTAAAHSLRAARRAARRVDAVIISPAFPSRSPSAGAPLGPLRLALLARAANAPAYALGGINNKTARRLLGAGLVGLAAVEGLSSPRT